MLLPGFKAYDIRGKFPEEINESFAYLLGKAFVSFQKAKTVVIGHDSRLTSPKLYQSLAKGIREMGADLYFLGLCGTEEVYFQTSKLKADGGIMITASHNPINYNGMKLVGRNAMPISLESGLQQISHLIAHPQKIAQKSCSQGSVIKYYDKHAYIDSVLSFISPDQLKPLKIVVNAGNGTAGAIIDQLESTLPFQFIKLNHHPDGHFPNGIPNPLLPERRAETKKAVIAYNADLGVAWDGDFDRCFIFDHRGRYVDSCYLIALLAKSILQINPNETIVMDTRVQWVIKSAVAEHSGVAVASSGGHSPMKASMRQHNAIYGGESSAHHYFRDFNYCDSGMIPWLLLTQLLSTENRALSDWIDDLSEAYPCSGEINFRVKDEQAIITAIDDYYALRGGIKNEIDGLSVAFDHWRFNLRASNTEPLLRLNVETNRSTQFLEARVAELIELIHSLDKQQSK